MVDCLLIQENRVIPAKLPEKTARQGLMIEFEGGLWTVARVEAAQPEWWMEMQRA